MARPDRPTRGQQKFRSIWVAGRLARTQGLSLEACPYVEKDGGRTLLNQKKRFTFTTAYRRAWIDGWKGMDKGFGVLKRVGKMRAGRGDPVGST